MYSRRTGIMYNHSEAQKKIESFNNDLRRQYRERSSAYDTLPQQNKPRSTEISDKLGDLLSNEDIMLIGLILLLLSQENKDYLVIGVLAALLFLNQ